MSDKDQKLFKCYDNSLFSLDNITYSYNGERAKTTLIVLSSFYTSFYGLYAAFLQYVFSV